LSACSAPGRQTCRLAHEDFCSKNWAPDCQIRSRARGADYVIDLNLARVADCVITVVAARQPPALPAAPEADAQRRRGHHARHRHPGTDRMADTVYLLGTEPMPVPYFCTTNLMHIHLYSSIFHLNDFS
jgi:hypothetical protein